jgi:hypothetical protein
VTIFLLKTQYELLCLSDAGSATVSAVILFYCRSRAHYSDMWKQST